MLDVFGEDGRVGEEFGGHGGPLGALSGEDEDGFAGGAGVAAGEAGCGVVAGQGVQGGEVVLAVVGDDHRTLVQQRTRVQQRVADIHRAQVRSEFERGGKALRLRHQRLGGVRGEYPRERRGGLRFGQRLRLRLRLDGGGLLQDDVRVGAADTERRHARSTQPVRLRPDLMFGQELDVAFGPVDVW